MRGYSVLANKIKRVTVLFPLYLFKKKKKTRIKVVNNWNTIYADTDKQAGRTETRILAIKSVRPIPFNNGPYCSSGTLIHTLRHKPHTQIQFLGSQRIINVGADGKAVEGQRYDPTAVDRRTPIIRIEKKLIRSLQCYTLSVTYQHDMVVEGRAVLYKNSGENSPCRSFVNNCK